MLRDVKSVRPLSDHRLHLQFDDGVEGEIDVAAMIAFYGVFEPLRNFEFFRKVAVHTELGVVCWPNGADLDTDVLYSEVVGAPLTQNETA